MYNERNGKEEKRMQIKELTIYVGNYNETRKFYEEVMGLNVYKESKQQITFQVGTSLLTIQEEIEQASFYHFAINIPPNLLQSAKVWLSNRVKLAMEEGEDEVDFKEAKAKAIYFEDPSGNIVELIARKTSAVASESHFHKAHFLNISEVGIVTNHIIELAQQLQDKGIPVRNNESIKHEKYLNFFGEYEDGVYIIVAPVGRRWIFSNKYAKEAPIIIRTDRGTIQS